MRKVLCYAPEMLHIAVMSKGRKKNMRKYEIMYILKPELGEEGTKAQIAKLNDILTKNGATVAKITEWGLKDIAYEMKGFKKGYYVILEVEAESEGKALKEFQRLGSLDANVIRFLITKANA